MKHNYNKWNKYTVGGVKFINSRRHHRCRAEYVNRVLASGYETILEIGAGEAIEAQKIRKQKPDVDYVILDVSDFFLKQAEDLGFTTVKAEMTDTGFVDKRFDLVYGCAVLEHSPDIQATIKELRRVSKNFYFTMFRWSMKSEELRHRYRKKKKFYSSTFNIYCLLDLIKQYGNIKEMFISTLDGKVIGWNEYVEGLGDTDVHRNGNWLSIVGEWRK